MEWINLTSNCLTSYTTIGDIVTYNIVCINQSSVTYESVFISNDLNPNLRFIPDSVVINNIERRDFNILTGFSVGKLDTCQKVTIQFEAEIISKDNDTITITTSADATYEEDDFRKSVVATSNCIVYVYNPSIYIRKYCNKEIAFLHDRVTYTIKIVNNGDVFLDKIILKDNVSKSLEVVENSFKINSKTVNDVDLEKGINVGCLNINDCILVTYDVIIDGKGVACNVSNEAFVTYKYYLDNGLVGSRESEVASYKLNVSLPSFKQVFLEEYINLPKQKDDICSVENVNTDIIIKHYHAIKTPIAKSTEGTVLSGYKLIIHGCVNQIIRYTAQKSNKPIHSIEHEIPFSSFIILPSDYEIGTKIQIESKEEYTQCNLVSPRCILDNTSILLIAKTLK